MRSLPQESEKGGLRQGMGTVTQIEDLDSSSSDRVSLTAYASLKTPHCGVFRAFSAPNPLRPEYLCLMETFLTPLGFRAE